MRWNQFPLLLYLDPLLDGGGLLVAGLDEVLQVDGLVRPLDGVGHHVEEERGERELYGVGERPGGVHEHHVATGEGGETLVVAVLVEDTDLVDSHVHAEGEAEHDQPGHHRHQVGPQEGETVALVKVEIDVLQQSERHSEQTVGHRRTSQRSRHIEFPRPVSVKLQHVASNDLNGLEVFVRVDISSVGGYQHQHDSQ